MKFSILCSIFLSFNFSFEALYQATLAKRNILGEIIALPAKTTDLTACKKNFSAKKTTKTCGYGLNVAVPAISGVSNGDRDFTFNWVPIVNDHRTYGYTIEERITVNGREFWPVVATINGNAIGTYRAKERSHKNKAQRLRPARNPHLDNMLHQKKSKTTTCGQRGRR